ncbi:MAG: cation-translocating P-type ATPase [Clostridia bacterium]|nr:cation-translocating P-type ATPase [Clostridia bacterium]
MKHYYESIPTVLRDTKSGEQGLTAAQAAERGIGKNKLAEGEKISFISRFFNQLTDPMILILLAAALISGLTAYFAHESAADVFIILFVVATNALLGVFQESKAEKALEALKEMTAATSKVLRDGTMVHLKSEDLVVGDIVLLEAGDAVPADLRIMESFDIKTEEAALTGESTPVTKISDSLPRRQEDCPLGDRINMAYMGSTVVYGRGKGIVTAIGMDTEMGKIASALSSTEESKTPLQKKLSQLSRILTWAVLGICLFIFLFTLLKEGDFSGKNLLSTFMVAVSLAVAAIPEGLATVVTIVLSVGVTKMSKRNAVIRKLTAVETLGCTQIICSDKTGTLTNNKMTVVDRITDNEALLAEGLALCSDAEWKDNQAEGEPTECALVQYAAQMGLKKPDLTQKSPRVGEIPFDSERKMMTTFHRCRSGTVQYTKGAPDVILARCTKVLSNGTPIPLTPSIRKELEQGQKTMTGRALRVLALGMRAHNTLPESYTSDNSERDLVFVGMVGMIDPVRDEVKQAIQKCRSAGIRPVMITGDHIDTAIAIAKELKILTDPAGAVTGAELDQMSEQEFQKSVERYSVYARVRPEHKDRIVRAWQSKGFVTAMTGDGVNDAPSIKSADIGIGMGITGTDVTKNVADMILADDNFSTIVSSVEEGRKIYDNIRKAIQFLLASNLSEVISIFMATVLGFTILNPVHILWINLITDTFPALALGVEKSEPDIMKRKPRNPKEGVFSGGVGFDVCYQGVLVSALTLMSYFIGHFIESGRWEIANSPDGMTMAFLTMSMAEIFHSFNLRSQRKSLFSLKNTNWILFGAMILSLILTTAVIYVPIFAKMFSFTPVSMTEYFTALGLAASVIPFVEIVKFFQRKIDK